MRCQGFEPAELANLTEALQRYHYYTEAGVQMQHIMHLESQWLHKILSLVPRDRYCSVSEDSYNSLMKMAVHEVHCDFHRSMRKAIIDYLLKSPLERR